MNKNLLFLIPVLGIIGYSFFYKGDHISNYHNDGIETVNFSVSPPAGKTGAPGEGNCTDCHSGTTMSSDGVVFFTVGGGPGYMPGDTYPITLSTLSGAKNGFELTIFDAEGNSAGEFTAGTGTNISSFGGAEYIRHSTTDEISWTFDWTAPDADMGELTAYYAVNISNNNGSTSGDEIFLGNTSIPMFNASIKENELDKAYEIFYNNATNELNLKYSLLNESKVVLNVQDLSGKLIEYYDFGYQASGNYQEKMVVTNVDKAGVYVLSLFINNQVFNRKVKLG